MASRSINRVILLGNLTRDPELKHTPNGTAVCTFGLATNRTWTTADGHTKDEAQYHRIVAWQKLAELCAKLLTKGKKVYVEGRITYRDYTTKEGMKKTVAEIVLDDFIVFNEGKEGKRAEGPSEEIVNIGQIEAEEFDISNMDAGEANSQRASTSVDKSHTSSSINPEDIPF